MTEFYFVIYEDGRGYKGLVYDDNGEEIEDSWEVEEVTYKSWIFQPRHRNRAGED